MDQPGAAAKEAIKEAVEEAVLSNPEEGEAIFTWSGKALAGQLVAGGRIWSLEGCGSDCHLWILWDSSQWSEEKEKDKRRSCQLSGSIVTYTCSLCPQQNCTTVDTALGLCHNCPCSRACEESVSASSVCDATSLKWTPSVLPQDICGPVQGGWCMEEYWEGWKLTGRVIGSTDVDEYSIEECWRRCKVNSKCKFINWRSSVQKRSNLAEDRLRREPGREPRKRPSKNKPGKRPGGKKPGKKLGKKPGKKPGTRPPRRKPSKRLGKKPGSKPGKKPGKKLGKPAHNHNCQLLSTPGQRLLSESYDEYWTSGRGC